MGGYILCQTPRATTPFFIKNIQMNIFSLEELCYYLCHNLYLADKSLFNEELCFWLATELKLPALAQRLRPYLSKAVSTGDLIYPIFKEINYLSYEELKKLNVELREMDAMPSRQRRKKKGDAFMKNGMYRKAIDLYTELLSEEGEDQSGLTRNICHNLGCAYSRLFQMEKAAELFAKAYEQSKDEQELISCLLAARTFYDGDAYLAYAAGLGAGEEVLDKVKLKIQAFEEKDQQAIMPADIDAKLEEIMREYHRSTMP